MIRNEENMMELNDKKVLYELDRVRGVVNFNRDGAFILGLITLRYLEDNPGIFYLSDTTKWSNLNTDNFYRDERLFYRAFQSIESDNPSLEGVFTSLHLPKLDNQGIFIVFNFVNNLNLAKHIAPKTFEIFLNALVTNDKQLGSHGTLKELGILIARLLHIQNGDIYDGTAGTAQLLVEMGLEAEKQNENYKLFGQEINSNIWSLAVMNMIIHDMPFDLKLGDVLSNPSFISNGKLQQFDYVAMDIPSSLSWKQLDPMIVEFDDYRRFIYGLPSKSKADWLFIQHALASLKTTGKAAIVTSLGILSSGGTDKKIREQLIYEDIIESVIVLPSNLLSYSTISVAIIIFNKDKSEERKGKIQFINATELFIKEKRKNVLSQENIDTIVQAHDDFANMNKLKKIVPIKDIKDGSLNYAKYFESNEIDSLFGKVEVNKKDYEKIFNSYRNLSNAGNLFRGTPIKSEDRPGTPEDYYLVQLSDIQDGQLDLDALSPITIAPDKADTFLLREGDLLISSRGISIKIAVVPVSGRKLVLSQNLICFRPNDETNPYFVKAFLESPVGMSYLTSSQAGSVLTALNVKDLETIKIPDISASEQAEIGWVIKKADTDLQETLQKAKKEYVEKYKEIYQHMHLTEAFNLIEE